MLSAGLPVFDVPVAESVDVALDEPSLPQADLPMADWTDGALADLEPYLDLNEPNWVDLNESNWGEHLFGEYTNQPHDSDMVDLPLQAPIPTWSSLV